MADKFNRKILVSVFVDSQEGGFLEAGVTDKRVHLYKFVPFALNT